MKSLRSWLATLRKPRHDHQALLDALRARKIELMNILDEAEPGSRRYLATWAMLSEACRAEAVVATHLDS